jgi:osmotically-inducible protein OsmY
VAVDDGVVTLTGQVRLRSHLPLLTGLAESADGVVRVDQRMDYELDDVTGSLSSPYPFVH